MAIKTPDILPGEPGYISKKERTAKKKAKEKRAKKATRKKIQEIGNLKLGGKGYRFGRPIITPRKEKKYPIWRYSRKIGEVRVSNEESSDEKITLSFIRFGGIGNYKHLIQDADFQNDWEEREEQLVEEQNNCYLCDRRLSKTAKPNLYHYNLLKKSTRLLEKAEEVPNEVAKGKLTIKEGWEKFNDIIEEGNRDYMSLKDTALICASCAKRKNLNN